MDVFTVRGVAKLLSVNEETVRRWIRDGRLHPERKGVGRQGSQISASSIKTFLDVNEEFKTLEIMRTLEEGISKDVVQSKHHLHGHLLTD